MTNQIPDEPDECAECGSWENMLWTKIFIEGGGYQYAWICDECGHAHASSDDY